MDDPLTEVGTAEGRADLGRNKGHVEAAAGPYPSAGRSSKNRTVARESNAGELNSRWLTRSQESQG